MAELRTEQETIETTSIIPSYKPDPDWAFTDSEGHYHIVVGKSTPTLMWTELPDEYEPGCCERCAPTQAYAYVCRACGEKVEPDLVVDEPADGRRKFVPGAKTAYLSLEGSEWILSSDDSTAFVAAAISAGWSDADIEAGLGDGAVRTL